MGNHRRRMLVVLAGLAAFLVLMGCGLLDDPGVQEERESQEREMERQRIGLAEYEKHKPEPDQALSSGNVLSVRVRYGNSGTTVCKVRIDNKRNNWYDYVEFTAHAGVLGSTDKPYDDYDFGSTNFNKQLTEPHYKYPKDADGEYTIWVTTAEGYETHMDVTWSNGEFRPNLLSFSVD